MLLLLQLLWLSTMMLLLSGHGGVGAVATAHRTLEEARAERQLLVRKHLKRLQKADGAIQLVGGAGDHEGMFEM